MSNLIKGVIMVNKEMLQDLPDPRSNRIKLSVIEKGIDMNGSQFNFTNIQSQLVGKIDSAIKEALTKNGIDITDLRYLKDHITRIIKEGDEFEHYYLDYGTLTEKRIISLQKNLIFDQDFDYDRNKYTVLASQKYY